MSEPNVLVNFQLHRDRPVRVKWHATDGVPGDGYKAQITAIRLDDGTRLAMDSSAILEHVAPDPAGGIGGYLISFTGMVGYAVDHPDRERVDTLLGEEVGYELVFVRDDDPRQHAVEGQDYELKARPRAQATKVVRGT